MVDDLLDLALFLKVTVFIVFDSGFAKKCQGFVSRIVSNKK